LEVRAYAAAGDGVRDAVSEALNAIPGIAKVETVDEKTDSNGEAGALSFRVYAEAANTLIGPVAQAVLTAGAEVRDLSVKQPSLEEVFIFLTGRHLR
jgi:ABC-2 type transport system ATP-binding protein